MNVVIFKRQDEIVNSVQGTKCQNYRNINTETRVLLILILMLSPDKLLIYS